MQNLTFADAKANAAGLCAMHSHMVARKSLTAPDVTFYFFPLHFRSYTKKSGISLASA